MELLGQIYLYLLIVLVAGFVAGWLGKALHAVREQGRVTDALQQEIGGLESSCQGLEEELRELEQEAGGFQTRAQTAELRAEELQDQLDGLRIALERAERDASTEELKRLRGRVRELDSIHALIQEREAKLFQLDFLFRTQIQDRDGELHGLRDELQAWKDRNGPRPKRSLAVEDPRQGRLFAQEPAVEVETNGAPSSEGAMNQR